MRKKMYIKMSNVTDITTFANIAAHVSGDVDVTKGKYCTDGASLMGLFGIDMSTGVTVEYPEDAIDFENFIKLFATDIFIEHIEKAE